MANSKLRTINITIQTLEFMLLSPAASNSQPYDLNPL